MITTRFICPITRSDCTRRCYSAGACQLEARCDDCGLATPVQELREGRCGPCAFSYDQKMKELGQ